MKYVLDTNAVSALMKGDPLAVGRLRRLAKEEVGIPQPVLAELEYGIQRLPLSKRRERLESRLSLLCGEILRIPWTDEVSRRFGSVKASLERRGEPIEDFDVAIAAHALAMGAILVTGNRAHVGRIRDLRIEDWEEAGDDQ